jgi:hypothetical protein
MLNQSSLADNRATDPFVQLRQVQSSLLIKTLKKKKKKRLVVTEGVER